MHIHFVCSGNTFRSRLAEAYVNSLKRMNLEASSSGINAHFNYNGAITWYAQRLLKYNNLIPYSQQKWTQTSNDLLKKPDVIIFMNRNIYEKTKKRYKIDDKKVEIWEIEDFNVNVLKHSYDNVEKEAIKRSERIFNDIKKKTDMFLKQH